MTASLMPSAEELKRPGLKTRSITHIRAVASSLMPSAQGGSDVDGDKEVSALLLIKVGSCRHRWQDENPNESVSLLC